MSSAQEVSSAQGVEIPPALAASYATSFGEAGWAWIAALPALVAEVLDRWELRRDGAPRSGAASLVVPVVGKDGARAVVRLQLPRAETAAALAGLQAWDGRGMVRLLDHDPGTGTMLLERLDGARTLASVEDDTAATQLLGELHARLLTVPAAPGLPHLGDVAATMLEQVPRAVVGLADPAERSLLRDWASVVAELVGEPGDRMLHWDLHHDNVLAAQREPWLAIDPEPLVGDPGFDLWPALDSRWGEVVAGGDPGRVVRRRFDQLTEVLELDRERASGWTLGRLLQNALWDLEDGESALAPAALVVAGALA